MKKAENGLNILDGLKKILLSNLSNIAVFCELSYIFYIQTLTTPQTLYIIKVTGKEKTMSRKLTIPIQHLDLFASILKKMGCDTFTENESKYSPDFSFSIGGDRFWGYKRSFLIEFNGDDDNTLQAINEQYEYVVAQLTKEQEKQD